MAEIVGILIVQLEIAFSDLLDTKNKATKENKFIKDEFKKQKSVNNQLGKQNSLCIKRNIIFHKVTLNEISLR